MADCKFNGTAPDSICTVCKQPLGIALHVMPRRSCGTASPTYILDALPGGNHLWACHNCDWTAEAKPDDPPAHVCGQPNTPRLGDKIEAALTSLGVTKEKWVEAKAAIGLPATCSCAARQQWLNSLDEKLQLGEKLTAFKAMFGWKDK